LLMGVESRYPLVKTRPEIVDILLRLGRSVEFRVTTAHLPAIPDGGSVVHVKAMAHPEVLGKEMVDAKLNSARIEDPGLIARGVACDIKGETRPVRVNH
jgi:hypothetical protein